jgi:hypothetical protein
MSNKDRRKIESILREPLTRHRFSLNGKIRAAQVAENPQPFTLEDLKAFFAALPGNTPDFKQEVLNAVEAVETGLAPKTPQFDTPEKQLVWGAAFAFLKVNPDAMKTWKNPAAEPGPLSETELWKQVIGTKAAYQELLSHAHHIREALRDKDTKYSWGEPGTGFSFNRQKNIIDIDLMQTMIVGFEHARADVYREIGHALLSVSYPKRMQYLYSEMRPLLLKENKATAKKGPKLTPEEYKKLQMLSTEWQLRRMMFMAAEENVANRFVANMGLQMLQDYSVSLNNTAVTQRAIGLTRLPADKNASEELRRYMNLCNAVQLNFFQNNGLFDNDDDGWFRVGVDPNMVRKTATLAGRPDGAKEDQDGVSHADFLHLRELCGGPKGLENLQPKQHERLYGWNNLMGRVARADQDRKAIIEEIWKLYAEDLIQKILTQANDQIDQQLKEAKEKQQEKGDEQDQDGDDGQEQDGDDGQEGDPSDGQGTGQGKGKGKGKGQKGKPQRGQQQGDPQDADEIDEDGEPSDDQEGDPQKDGQNKKGDKKDGKKGDKKDKGEKAENGEKQDGDPQDGDKDGEKSEGAEGKLGADGEETVPVEGAGDMPKSKGASEVPADETDPGADGKDADGEGKDADGADADEDAKTMEELEKEAEEADEDGDDADAEGEDAEGEDADGKKKGKKNGKGKGKGKGAGHGDGRSLADLAKQDWKDYPARIAELSEPIQQVRKIFKEIQKRQLQRKSVMSKSLDILPENGEVKDRFNMEAHRNLTIKKLAGGVEENDLKRFNKDENKLVPTEIDIVILIDGSGSMGSAMGSGPSPLQSALQASAILYEAAAGKDMKMNVYVGMWGDSDPPILIKPGDDRITVGKAMEKMRGGLNSGTDFAPAIAKTAETIGEQRGKSGTLSGFTHVLVISDGDMFDVAESKEKMHTMFEYSDKVTFDVAIITANRGTQMEKMANSMKSRKPSQEMGVVLGSDPNKVPMAIVGLLLDKIRKCGSFTAVPNTQKRRAMKKAHNKMDKKR